MTLTHLLVLLLVGAVAGLIGERLVSRGMPGGLLGAIVAGLVGAWLMVDVLHVVIAPELSIGGIPILSAILGAAIVVLLFSLVRGGSFARGWSRSQSARLSPLGLADRFDLTSPGPGGVRRSDPRSCNS